MNHSIATADRNTQLKIVIVSLVAAIMVATIGIAARLNATGVELTGVDSAPTKVVVKPTKPVVWTDSRSVTIQ